MDLTEALNHGAELHRAGRLAEAEAAYRAVLAQVPNHPDALHLLGLIARAAGREDAAIDLIRRAVVAQPVFPAAHYNLGRILHDRGDLPAAEGAYRQALAGKPDYAEAWDNLGGALQAQGRPEEALAAYHKALELRPDYPHALSNLGTLLQDLGRAQEAIDAYQRALELQPDYAEALHNMGEALQDLNRPAQAIAYYRRALVLRSDYAEAHCGLAFALLRTGAFEEGWAEYEWRWQRRDLASERRNLPGPPWDGSDPSGKTILVYAEQGFGDTIQFSRFASLLASQGVTIVLECQPALERLLRSLRGIAHVIARGQPLPAFDAHVPLLSLPLLLGHTAERTPAGVPYLAAPPDVLAAWRRRIPPEDVLRVGLVWAANPFRQQARSFRSMTPGELAPLAQMEGIRFYSLQKGSANANLKVIDLAPELGDFADTAAAILQLDLVITVDTSVAHLAGALGRPVWVMLPFAAEWRWLKDRQDSPWYPTMRLFRQPIWGDWAAVVHRIATELATLSESRSAK